VSGWSVRRGARAAAVREVVEETGLTARIFDVVTFSSFVLGFGAYGSFYLLSLFLQQVQGASAAGTGVEFLPYSLGIAAGSVLGGRIGGDRLMLAGYTMIGAGLVSLLTVTGSTAYPLIAVLFAILGVGMGFAITTTNSAAVTSVGRERSGTAAAIVNAARQTGTALGIAALGAIVNAHLAGGGDPAAFTSGLHVSVAVAGGLTLVAAALVASVPRPRLELVPPVTRTDHVTEPVRHAM
jgi:DHA2 family methylenomycin A resistance protein-like MFS transporter